VAKGKNSGERPSLASRKLLGFSQIRKRRERLALFIDGLKRAFLFSACQALARRGEKVESLCAEVFHVSSSQTPWLFLCKVHSQHNL